MNVEYQNASIQAQPFPTAASTGIPGYHLPLLYTSLQASNSHPIGGLQPANPVLGHVGAGVYQQPLYSAYGTEPWAFNLNGLVNQGSSLNQYPENVPLSLTGLIPNGFPIDYTQPVTEVELEAVRVPALPSYNEHDLQREASLTLPASRCLRQATHIPAHVPQCKQELTPTEIDETEVPPPMLPISESVIDETSTVATPPPSSCVTTVTAVSVNLVSSHKKKGASAKLAKQALLQSKEVASLRRRTSKWGTSNSPRKERVDMIYYFPKSNNLAQEDPLYCSWLQGSEEHWFECQMGKKGTKNVCKQVFKSTSATVASQDMRQHLLSHFPKVNLFTCPLESSSGCKGAAEVAPLEHAKRRAHPAKTVFTQGNARMELEASIQLSKISSAKARVTAPSKVSRRPSKAKGTCSVKLSLPGDLCTHLSTCHPELNDRRIESITRRHVLMVDKWYKTLDVETLIVEEIIQVKAKEN